MARQHHSPRNQSQAEALRSLPSVDTLLQALMSRFAVESTPVPPHRRLSQAARDAIQIARDAIRSGQPVDCNLEALVAHARTAVMRAPLPTPPPVINATGVIINTNLGRAPLSNAALEAVAMVATGYSALEYDLEHGERGSRQRVVRDLICELVGAEAALVVNNNAAAMLVSLSALASERAVIISRGELVEIGGGFRIPDVLRQSGARLVEVGTTNRTRIGDFSAAITPETALLLSVHSSNYRIVGFTAAPSLRELAELAHRQHLPLLHDLGSGALLRTERWGLAHEPMPQESLAAGADLVCFSGDKLLGGPQAGILAGKAEIIECIEHHPLARAVRIDKMTLAALAATLRAYHEDTAVEEIPVWRMIAMPLEEVKARATRWVDMLRGAGIAASMQPGFSTIGGGSMPGETLPTWHCAVTPRAASLPVENTGTDAAALFASRLRNNATPVVARVLRDQVLLDPRTVLAEQDSALLAAAREAEASAPVTGIES